MLQKILFALLCTEAVLIVFLAACPAFIRRFTVRGLRTVVSLPYVREVLALLVAASAVCFVIESRSLYGAPTCTTDYCRVSKLRQERNWYLHGGQLLLMFVIWDYGREEAVAPKPAAAVAATTPTVGKKRE
eukprot:TRINITY_DN8197_c0_g2_i1.p1 TRINITY_DN8197_c0_g2~~TRINITY_DN8197_c0_g2_i1.p1  ORF type:complete len:131 (+),score=28.85 TRINITY_DN8197_c0_g2_i1:78-470(+)